VATYNVRDLLRACLESLGQGLGALEAEVYVVDNDSRDGTPEMVLEDFPGVHLIRNRTNEGFARANNRALDRTRGRHVLILNPDTLLPPDTLEPLVAFLDAHGDIGVVGPRVVRPDGRLDEACRRGFPTPLSALGRFLALDRLFPRSRLLGSYRQTFRDPALSYEVDAIVGACMLLRRQALEDVGGLDESYFMFGEDLDWCWRFKGSGWRIWYLGQVHVIHHKGASVSTAPYAMNWHFHRSMVRFHRKHLVERYPFFINWAVYCGVGLRYALKSAVMLVRGTRARPVVPMPAPGGSREGEAGVAAAEA
jgi:hypothetical protein